MDGSSGEWNSARVDAVRGMEKERKQAGYDQHGWQGDTKVVALFALPTFAAFIIGFVIPFIMGVYLSFCKFATVTDAEFVGLKNYKRAFADKEFLHALGFSTALTIITTIVINVVAFAIAYMLTKAIKAPTSSVRCSSCRTSSVALSWATSGCCCSTAFSLTGAAR